VPDVENVEPWHGHTNWEPEKPVTVQPSCVHVAVRTVALVVPVLVIRKLPRLVCAMAIPPVLASAPEPTAIVTTRPLTTPDTDVNGVEFADGDVGLPPQPATVPRASSPAALPQPAQNSRRVCVETSSSLITSVTSSGQKIRSAALLQA